jgi:hypothetical protein
MESGLRNVERNQYHYIPVDQVAGAREYWWRNSPNHFWVQPDGALVPLGQAVVGGEPVAIKCTLPDHGGWIGRTFGQAYEYAYPAWFGMQPFYDKIRASGLVDPGASNQEIDRLATVNPDFASTAMMFWNWGDPGTVPVNRTKSTGETLATVGLAVVGGVVAGLWYGHRNDARDAVMSGRHGWWRDVSGDSFKVDEENIAKFTDQASVQLADQWKYRVLCPAQAHLQAFRQACRSAIGNMINELHKTEFNRHIQNLAKIQQKMLGLGGKSHVTKIMVTTKSGKQKATYKVETDYKRPIIIAAAALAISGGLFMLAKGKKKPMTANRKRRARR